jgi:hypothetical protein
MVRPRSLALIGLSIVCGSAAGSVGYRVMNPPAPGVLKAVVIRSGMNRTNQPPSDNGGIDPLATDTNEAGYRWAERHGIVRFLDCSSAPGSFRDGCVEWVEELTLEGSNNGPLEPTAATDGCGGRRIYCRPKTPPAQACSR